jgi:hypothetical protein
MLETAEEGIVIIIRRRVNKKLLSNNSSHRGCTLPALYPRAGELEGGSSRVEVRG